MDDVVSILVVVVAVALAAYQRYVKKEKKKNVTSRKKVVGPAPASVEAATSVLQEKRKQESQCAVNKQDKRTKGEGRKHRKVSGEPQERNVQHAALPSVPGRDIRLKTPEEARRAFIYSEIFNRKY
ncbi:hypothetical protein [Phocaeicola sp.]|uniref:hypothetical protein n=1 Tax=Phocaeicola sp. TaxID=2773926 RepID=UPI003AB33C5A